MPISQINTNSIASGQTFVLNGITFPATQSASTDANTLDDYEEGTFTPALSGNVTNPTVTYNSREGTYTKVGNRVFFNIWLNTSTVSGGTGTVNITGLPFTSNSSALNLAAVTISEYQNITTAANRIITAFIVSSSNFISFSQSITGTTGGAPIALPPTNVTNSAYMILSGQYIV
jgi:hypothetical protein